MPKAKSGSGVAASPPGSRPSGRASKAVSPVPASIPNAVRRTFKPFAQGPRDGTAFIVPHIARYNPYAKTFEYLMRDQHSGALEWVATPRVWLAGYFCDLLPLSFDLPTTFTMTLVASPARRPNWFRRLMGRMLGKLPYWMVAHEWRTALVKARSA